MVAKQGTLDPVQVVTHPRRGRQTQLTIRYRGEREHGKALMVRRGLMEGAVLGMAIDGNYYDRLWVGLEDEDLVMEAYLVELKSDNDRALFYQSFREHSGESPTEDEVTWLEGQVGAIWIDSGSGMDSIDFYEETENLDEAWQEETKRAGELQEEIEKEAEVEERKTRRKVKQRIARGEQAVLPSL